MNHGRRKNNEANDGEYEPTYKDDSSSDPLDGSKNWGIVIREGDGKYGSFPSYDDYGEESEP